jgi:hypothetical protein
VDATLIGSVPAGQRSCRRSPLTSLPSLPSGNPARGVWCFLWPCLSIQSVKQNKFVKVVKCAVAQKSGGWIGLLCPTSHRPRMRERCELSLPSRLASPNLPSPTAHPTEVMNIPSPPCDPFAFATYIPHGRRINIRRQRKERHSTVLLW